MKLNAEQTRKLFKSELMDVMESLGIKVTQFVLPTDAEFETAINAVEAYEKRGDENTIISAMFFNGKMVGFRVNGEDCDADEDEAKAFFEL